MKNLLILLLTCASLFGQSRPMSYDAITRNVAPTDLDYVGTTANFTSSLQRNGVNVVDANLTLTMTGTANEITLSAGAQTLAANRTWTFSLPAALTFTGKTITGGTYSSPTLTTPTIASFANATHTHADAAGGGVLTPVAIGLADPNADRILFWDDSAGVFAWLTAGSGLTITTTTMTASGSGGGTAGTVINTGTPVQYNLPYYLDTTGTNIGPSSLSTDSTLTNFYAGGFFINTLTVTNPIPVTSGGLGIASGTSGGIPYFSASTTIASSGALTANAVVVGGGAGAAPSSSAVSINAGVVTGASFDASGTGNTLKFTSYQDLVFPSRVDGAGTTIVTNDYTSGLWGLATSNGTADTNANYAIFRVGTVPYDLDTSVAMVLKGFSIRVSGTDTDAAQFTIGLWSPASSSAFSPTDFTSLSTFINFDSGTLTSPAANDIFYFSDVTLTGWAAAVTAGRPLIIGIARRNGSNDDSVTIVSGTIASGRTQ